MVRARWRDNPRSYRGVPHGVFLMARFPAAAALGWLPGALVAHQGGWDEILMVGGPIAVFAVLLYSANKRAGRLGERRQDPDGTPHERDRPAGPR